MQSEYSAAHLVIDQSVNDYRKFLSDNPSFKKVAIDSIEASELPELPKSLIKIIIHNCANLVNLNKSLSNCTQLKKLYISDCDKLAEIPLNCKQLKKLYLSKWSPELILELPNSLEEFSILNSENLKKLPESISECKQLRAIGLYNNKNLEKLPESLSGCINLKHLSIDDCEKIMEITNLPISLDNLDINLSSGENFQSTPKLSNYSQLKNLSLSGNKFTSISELPNSLVSLSINCRNLETLPDLSNLTNLQELKLYGCSSLVFTPELTQKLSALEQTCSIRYPSHFRTSVETEKCKARLKKVIENFEKNNLNVPVRGGIDQLLERFLTEGIDQRINVEASLRTKADIIAKSTEPFLDFIEKNPKHLPWINQASQIYIAACINQPVWGFFEINSLIQLVKEENFLDKVTSAKTLFTFAGIKNIVLKNNPGDTYQVEAGNLLLIDLHQQLLNEKIIQKPWMGVPEKIAFESFVKDWHEKPNIKSELTELKKEIAGKTHEDYISILCGNQYAGIWEQIAFPNNEEIQAIKDHFYNQILEESNSEEMDKITNERLIAISKKLAELTRDKIAKEANEINSQQLVPDGETKPNLAKQIPDLQLQEASSRLPSDEQNLDPTRSSQVVEFSDVVSNSERLKELSAMDSLAFPDSSELLASQPHISSVATRSESPRALLIQNLESFPNTDEPLIPRSFSSSPQAQEALNPPSNSLDFSATHDNSNNIIKFKIKSGPEGSGTSSAGLDDAVVGKFYYNKKLDDNVEYIKDDYTKEKEHKNILDLLTVASEATKQKFPSAGLDKDFFIVVMKVASKNSGIANITETEFINDLKTLNRDLDRTNCNLGNDETLHKIAKYFSAEFQSLSKEKNYFTARERTNGKFNDTGRRLFRVCTEENIKAFQEMPKALAINITPQPQELEAGPATTLRSPRLSEGLLRSASASSDIGST